jgi:hypothetical protein
MNKINTDEYNILEGKCGLGHKYAEEKKNELIFKKPEDDKIKFIEGFTTNDLILYVCDNYDNGNIKIVTYTDDPLRTYIFEREDEYSKYECIGIIPFTFFSYELNPNVILRV